MQIRCPVCNTLTTWQENRFRPFCSERCKLIDLGRWATEQYKVVEPIGQQSDVLEDMGQTDRSEG
jgi:endogenous inhibitor of DNA gyrase (YacG/DUF329 family)